MQSWYLTVVYMTLYFGSLSQKIGPDGFDKLRTWQYLHLWVKILYFEFWCQVDHLIMSLWWSDPINFSLPYSHIIMLNLTLCMYRCCNLQCMSLKSQLLITKTELHNVLHRNAFSDSSAGQVLLVCNCYLYNSVHCTSLKLIITWLRKTTVLVLYNAQLLYCWISNNRSGVAYIFTDVFRAVLMW